MARHTPEWSRLSPPLAAVSGGMLLAGCQTGGYETVSYHGIHGIPNGPGLITHEAGEYTILSRYLYGMLGDSGSQSSTQAVSAPRIGRSSVISKQATPA